MQRRRKSKNRLQRVGLGKVENSRKKATSDADVELANLKSVLFPSLITMQWLQLESYDVKNLSFPKSSNRAVAAAEKSRSVRMRSAPGQLVILVIGNHRGVKVHTHTHKHPFIHTHMGQFLQGGKNGRLVSYFF